MLEINQLEHWTILILYVLIRYQDQVKWRRKTSAGSDARADADFC